MYIIINIHYVYFEKRRKRNKVSSSFINLFKFYRLQKEHRKNVFEKNITVIKLIFVFLKF